MTCKVVHDLNYFSLSRNILPTAELVGCALQQCQNGGTCEEEEGSDDNCTCAPGFTGVHCETGLLTIKHQVCSTNSNKKPIP